MYPQRVDTRSASSYGQGVAYAEPAEGEYLVPSSLPSSFADLAAREPSQPIKDAQLIMAATYGETARLQELLDGGADHRFGNYRALRMAASNGHRDSTQILIEAEAERSSPAFLEAKRDAERKAARGGYDDVIRLLIETDDARSDHSDAVRLAQEGKVQGVGLFRARRPTPEHGHAKSIELLLNAPSVLRLEAPAFR